METITWNNVMKLLITKKSPSTLAEEGTDRATFVAMTMEEQTIVVAINQLAGWLLQYSPLLKNGSAIGLRIGVSTELAYAIKANLRREDAEEVLANLVKL